MEGGIEHSNRSLLHCSWYDITLYICHENYSYSNYLTALGILAGFNSCSNQGPVLQPFLIEKASPSTSSNGQVCMS